MAAKKKISKKQVKEEIPEIIQTELDNHNGPLGGIYKNKKLTLLIMGIILAFISFFLYVDTLDHDLVYCDDNIFVHDYENYNINSNFVDAFDRTFGTSYYRPILGMSFVWDAKAGKAFFDEAERDGKKIKGNINPTMYQLTNNMLHVIGVLLTFTFLIYMGYDIIACFFLALIFAVHPILTPAVSWISGRNDSLLGISILLSFISLMQFYRSKSKNNRIIWYTLHMIIFAGALFTKEISAMFPFLIVAYNLFFRENVFDKVKGKYKFSARQLFSNENLILGAGWMVVGLIWWSLRTKAFEGITNPDTIGMEAVMKNLPMPLALVGKMFAPIKMLALPTFEQFSIVSGLIFIVALILLAFNIKDVRKRNVAFGLTWFLLFIVPALFVRILDVDDFFDYAEHRAYLVINGIFIVVLELMRAGRVNYQKPITIGIFTVIALLFAFKSYNYQQTFDGRKNFWGHKTEMEPQVARGYLDLGKAYLVNGEINEADSLYRHGMKINPENANFYIDLSVIRLNQKNYAEAEKLSRKALQLKPNEKMAFLNLGNALFFQQKYDESIKMFLQGLRRFPKNHPNHFDMLHKVGIAYHNKGNINEAMKYYNAALQINQNEPQLLSNYGFGLSTQQGKKDDAEKILITAIQKGPKLESAYANLINHYLRHKEFNKIPAVVQTSQNNGVKIRPQIINQLKKLGMLK